MAGPASTRAGIPVSTHLFGSREGYRTLARSVDVSDAEDAELAGFGFGQTADPMVLEALEIAPTAYGRPLAGGRVAITRIFAGPPDESGRATLELRSILISPAAIADLLAAGFGWLLHQKGLWNREVFERGEHAVASPARAAPDRSREAEEAFAAWSETVLDPDSPASPGEVRWRPIGERPLVVLEPEPEGSAALAAMAASLTPVDLASLRWGVRLLSTGAPVDVATISPAGRVSSGRMVVRHRMGTPDLGLAAEAIEATRDAERLPSVAMVLRTRAGRSKGRRRSAGAALRTTLLAATPIVLVVALILAIADRPSEETESSAAGVEIVSAPTIEIPTDATDAERTSEAPEPVAAEVDSDRDVLVDPETSVAPAGESESPAAGETTAPAGIDSSHASEGVPDPSSNGTASDAVEVLVDESIPEFVGEFVGEGVGEGVEGVVEIDRGDPDGESVDARAGSAGDEAPAAPIAPVAAEEIASEGREVDAATGSDDADAGEAEDVDRHEGPVTEEATPGREPADETGSTTMSPSLPEITSDEPDRSEDAVAPVESSESMDRTDPDPPPPAMEESSESTAGDEVGVDAAGEEVEPVADRPPPDPCRTCGLDVDRVKRQVDRALDADEQGNRDEFEAQTAGVIASLRSIGLDAVPDEDRPAVFARLRGSGRVDSGRFEEEWPSMRLLLCRLEAWHAVFDDLEAIVERYPTSAAYRREILALRRDSLWLLGSGPIRATEIRVRIGRLKSALSRRAEFSEDPRAMEIKAWLDLEREIGSSAWSDARFAPPAATIGGGPDR